MGFDIHTARLLLLAKHAGIDFSSVATLGHQWLRIRQKSLLRIFEETGTSITREQLSSIYASLPYSDGFLRALGASQIESVDASEYEGASIIHDMNQAIPDALRSRFSLVIDSGTLEHIFNFPVAIRNCMSMVRVGGSFITQAPVNNFMGHGFYQFSPELFFRVLSAENGFTIRRAFLCEERFSGAWYELPDPAVVGCRIELINRRPAHLMVVATKVADCSSFARTPQQSDYELGHWTEGLGQVIPESVPLDWKRKILYEVLPPWVRDLRVSALRVLQPPFRAKYFKRIDVRKVRLD